MGPSSPKKILQLFHQYATTFEILVYKSKKKSPPLRRYDPSQHFFLQCNEPKQSLKL